jgi:hypothetical protein
MIEEHQSKQHVPQALVLGLLVLLVLIGSLGSTMGQQQCVLQMSSNPGLHTAWMLAACHAPFQACPWCW